MEFEVLPQYPVFPVIQINQCGKWKPKKSNLVFSCCCTTIGHLATILKICSAPYELVKSAL